MHTEPSKERTTQAAAKSTAHRWQIEKRGYAPQDAAYYLGVSKSSLDHSRLTGNLCGIPAPPFVRLGRMVRYLREQLDSWLDGLPRHRHTAETAADDDQDG